VVVFRYPLRFLSQYFQNVPVFYTLLDASAFVPTKSPLHIDPASTEDSFRNSHPPAHHFLLPSISLSSVQISSNNPDFLLRDDFMIAAQTCDLLGRLTGHCDGCMIVKEVELADLMFLALFGHRGSWCAHKKTLIS
jgi:hypothetical protein